MKIQIKNIKFFEGHDGMTGLNADIYIKGIKCLHVYDDAWGGMFTYTSYANGSKNPEKVKSLIKDFEEYLKTLPKQEINIGGKKTMIPVDMDMFVNDLVNKQEEEKAKRKMERYMKQSIVFGKPNASSYQVLKFKRALADIPQAILQQQVNKVKHEYCTKGVVILNTNLKELNIKI